MRGIHDGDEWLTGSKHCTMFITQTPALSENHMSKTRCPANDTEPNANSLIKRITKIQDRAKSEGVIADGQDSKPMMDAAWGEPDLKADAQRPPSP